MTHLKRPFRNEYQPSDYTAQDLPHWVAAAHRQRAKDAVIVPRLAKLLTPGRTLELGAGSGQIALLLQQCGLEVIASDYVPEFVRYMRAQGLQAFELDALDIAAAGLGSFANIYSQSISPFITSDSAVLEAAYRSSYDVLQPNGRFLMIHAMAPYREVRRTMEVHRDMATRAGFREVEVFRNQALPSFAYRPPLATGAALLESLLGRRIGVRFVLTATR